MKSKSTKANLTAPVPTKTLPPAPANPEAQRARLLERDARGKNTHHYTKAGDTDVAATIRRIQRQLKDNEAALHKAATTVCELKRKATK